MDPLRVGYIGVFGVASLLCFASIRNTSQIDSPDTKRGLVWLLVFSGGWAGAHVGRLAAPTANLKITFYLIGLVLGLGSVGAWLYFCSAYAGHDYHRVPKLRQLAFALYVIVVSIKLTNPLHNLYFTTSFVTEPFPHLVIELSTLHWVVTGLAYALTAVGFYLLYEMYRGSSFDTRILSALVGLTALPVVLNIIGYAGPGVIIKLNYEPIGVALFAVGALFVVNDQFVAIPRFWRKKVIESLDEIVILVDVDGRVRDYNITAVQIFPELAGAIGEKLETVRPDLGEVANSADEILALESGENARYYLIATTPLESGGTEVGQTIVGTDVTTVERQRRELERQNEQFDDFAEAITHELRNAIAVVDGYLDIAAEDLHEGTDTKAAFAEARAVMDRMNQVVDDLSTVARYGQTLEEMVPCDLEAAAEAALGSLDEELDLTVERTRTIQADQGRLEALFRDAFRFAATNGARSVTVSLTDDGFAITGDGDPIPRDRTEAAFDYGSAVPSMEAGMSLPNVRTLARVHGWSASIDAEHRDGVRIYIEGVDVGKEPSYEESASVHSDRTLGEDT